ncbi:MAG: NAD(P)/FAD-dependent oxidoreductase, partial [Terriglobia bacterium]
LKAAREYLHMRFPAMRGAPVVESRVCQYENTPDRHLIFDRHPQAGNAWLLGGGSGHGFKMGPAIGERAAQVILGRREPDRMLRLDRF